MKEYFKQPYKEETYPDDVKYVVDNDINRLLLTQKLGKTDNVIIDDRSYILINIGTKTWTSTFTFQWLYRNQPPLLTQDELIDLLETL